MANRVTPEEVKEIIDTALDPIDAYITSANLLVTNCLGDSGQSEDALKEIERWLSAHFIAISDKSVNIKSMKLGDAAETYQGVTGMGLDATFYGQQAKILDKSGTLDTLGSPAVQFEVL